MRNLAKAGLAGLGIAAAVALAPNASADPSDYLSPSEIAFADKIAPAACGALDQRPSVAGVLGVAVWVTKHGIPSPETARFVVMYDVANYCPEHTQLIFDTAAVARGEAPMPTTSGPITSGPALGPDGRYHDGDGEGETCVDGAQKTSADSGITYTCSSGFWHEGPTLIPAR
jgi:hypothetical protein